MPPAHWHEPARAMRRRRMGLRAIGADLGQDHTVVQHFFNPASYLRHQERCRERYRRRAADPAFVRAERERCRAYRRLP